MQRSLPKYKGMWLTKEERAKKEEELNARLKKATKVKGMNKSKVYSATYSPKI